MTTINEAFKANGIRAEYKGMPGMILPVTEALAADLDQSKVKQGVEAGQMLVSWTEGEKRNGKVIHSDAANDITLLIARNDGSDRRIGAQSMTGAVLDVQRTINGAREDAARVEKANVEAREAYEAAIERGENVEEPEDRTPEFDASAFKGIDGLIACVQTAQAAIKSDPLADIAAKASADTFTAKLRELTRDDLTGEEKARVSEMRNLKAEIAMLAPDHVDAAASVLPPRYEGDLGEMHEVLSELPQDPQGISAAQSSAMSSAGNMELVNRLFSVATTVPAMQVGKRPLSHTGFQTIAQELAKSKNAEASDQILPRMSAVTGDAMPDYKWQGQVYTKDDTDFLLMRDEYAAFLYAWPSDSRVGEIDLQATVLQTATSADVPSEEQLEELREAVSGLRFDNGAEVNFDWDEEDELFADPEDEDAFDM